MKSTRAWRPSGPAPSRPRGSRIPRPRAQSEKRLERNDSGQDEYFGSAGECDYGFTKVTKGVYTERSGPTTPTNVVDLALKNFATEWRALRESIAERNEYEEMTDSGHMDSHVGANDTMMSMEDEDVCLNFQDELKKLSLNPVGIYERELKRQKEGDYFKKKSWIIKFPYLVLCWLLDRVYSKDRPIQRFWLLETVARMPYFSYISMLHLYETLGWWRRGAAVKRVHFAEEWNEFHHLLIMESLGGDDKWIDRFAGYHGAIVYYWILNLLWLMSPQLAYQFSEMLENHAVDTYGQFVDENESILKTLPAPAIAKQYYQSEDLYMFDEFQTSRKGELTRRRPEINTLYDTFANIRDDELEHVKTMVACQNTDIAVRSPHQD